MDRNNTYNKKKLNAGEHAILQQWLKHITDHA